MKIELGPLPEETELHWDANDGCITTGYTADQMRSYAEQEVAKERERMAIIVETWKASPSDFSLDELADAIRNGGAK